MSDVLSRIVADKRAHVAERRVAMPDANVEAAAKSAPPPRGFAGALRNARSGGRTALIAEVKKASPSKGLIRAEFDPPALARAYASAGASCLSVLTDTPYFQGRDSDLVAARAACTLPVLRKDFMIDPYQIAEARALGADCILLILACLSDSLASELEAAAFAWGMDVLIEVHDRDELHRALDLKSPLLGVNNRNLKTLAVDIETTVTLATDIPPDRFLISESGLYSRADLDRMEAAGAQGFLVGESLMRQADVEAATRLLLTGSHQGDHVPAASSAIAD